MGLVDEVREAIIALLIVIVVFWYVLPKISKVTGADVWYAKPLGVLIVVLIILGLIAKVRR